MKFKELFQVELSFPEDNYNFPQHRECVIQMEFSKSVTVQVIVMRFLWEGREEWRKEGQRKNEWKKEEEKSSWPLVPIWNLGPFVQSPSTSAVDATHKDAMIQVIFCSNWC